MKAPVGSTPNPTPEGLHTAICYGVIDIGTHQNNFDGKAKFQRQIVVMWELPEERITVERDGQELDLPRAQSNFYTLSMHSKAKLRKHVEGIRGKKFSDAEAANFDLKDLIGVPCQLQIVHTDNGYARIDSIVMAPKGMFKELPVKTENEPVYFDLDENPDAIPDKMPEWVKKKIGESIEWDQDEPETQGDTNIPF